MPRQRLSVDDFDFSLMLTRVRRQVTMLGKEFLFALPKNDKIAPLRLSPVLARAVMAVHPSERGVPHPLVDLVRRSWHRSRPASSRLHLGRAQQSP